VGYTSSLPIVWQYKWPLHITSLLVTDSIPSGSITNSDLELAGGLLHLDALAQSVDICERTILSQGDNLSTTFWEWKGSTSTASAPAYLLRLFGIHQRIHRYIPRFDYISGASLLRVKLEACCKNKMKNQGAKYGTAPFWRKRRTCESYLIPLNLKLL
jgi:hypothetical protein